jgi:hypothetical protein
MAKKKKPDRGNALNELKTLESKWLKDNRVEALDPIQVKVMAAKVAALVEYIESNDMPISFTDWPLTGAEELVKMDESAFKSGLSSLQKVGVLNSSMKIRKVASGTKVTRTFDSAEHESEDGTLTYRCAKPGGINLSDRDEYIAEDAEVTYSEEAIAESPNLQNAIANEWLIRIDKSE